MIADALKFEIEAHVVRTRAHNRLFKMAHDGRATAEIMARYLSNVRYSISQTPPMLERAKRSALARGERALAEHFAHKLGEETGHDRWAEHDIEVLASHRAARFEGRPEQSILALYDYLEPAVDQDPRVYLAYMLWAEYFTVLAGSEFVTAVIERCEIPPEAITSVSHHVELDREHTSEGLEAIDRLVEDPAMLAPMRESMRRAMAFFDRFCDELLEPVWSRDGYEHRVAG